MLNLKAAFLIFDVNIKDKSKDVPYISYCQQLLWKFKKQQRNFPSPLCYTKLITH